MSVGGSHTAKDQRGLLWTLLGLVLVCAMPSGRSLWLDEGYTAPYARDVDASSFIDRMLSDEGSEALRPLGMLSFWVGAKIFGSSELGLRAVSAMWAAIAVLLLWRTGRMIGGPWLPSLLAAHPFLWYYAGDARPYTMLVAMGAGLLYALVAVLAGGATTDRGLGALLIFGVLVSATDVLGVLLFGPVFGVVVGLLVRQGWRPRSRQLAAFGTSIVILAALGVYYVVTVSRGVETGWEGVWRVGLGNLLFAAYEHLGFAGFGPGRNELRQAVLGGELEAVIQTFVRPSAVGLPILGVLYVVLLLRLARRLRAGLSGRELPLFAVGAVIAMTTAAIFAVSVVVKFPFWGRHLAALCPFIVLFVALAVGGSREHTRSWPDPLTLCLGIVWLVSSLLLRFHDTHRRDDYRSASGIARTAVERGETVWWVASPHCGEYYGLRFCDPPSESEGECVVWLESPDFADLRILPDPDLIVISRPEFFDHRGAIRSRIASNGFAVVEQPVAFQIFRAADIPE